MSDSSLTASLLELSAQIEELRNQMPKPPVMEYNREQFSAMSPADQTAFIRRGGRVYDALPPVKPKLPDGAIRRSDFDAMGPAERHKLIRGGSVVHD